MTVNAVVSSVFPAACALFTVTTHRWMLIFIILRSAASSAAAPPRSTRWPTRSSREMSRATTLVSVNQQPAISAGVSSGVLGGIDHALPPRHGADAHMFGPAFMCGDHPAASPGSSGRCPTMPATKSGPQGTKFPAAGAAKAATKAASEGTEDARGGLIAHPDDCASNPTLTVTNP
jgi:hypothetical protein